MSDDAPRSEEPAEPEPESPGDTTESAEERCEKAAPVPPVQDTYALVGQQVAAATDTPANAVPAVSNEPAKPTTSRTKDDDKPDER